MANEARGETTILDMESTVWNTEKDSGCTVVSKSGKTYKLPLNQIPIINGNGITSIVKVTELPESPDANTLYLVVEEESTTTIETEGEG